MQALPYIGMIAQVVGTVAQFTSRQASTTANVAIPKQQQRQAAVSRDLEIMQSRRRSELIMSRQRAAAAAAGVSIESGTPLEVLLDSAYQAELEAETLRYGGDVRISEAKWEEKLAKTRGTQSYAGLSSGLGSILASNASILSDLWSRGNTAMAGTYSSGAGITAGSGPIAGF